MDLRNLQEIQDYLQRGEYPSGLDKGQKANFRRNARTTSSLKTESCTTGSTHHSTLLIQKFAFPLVSSTTSLGSNIDIILFL